jgi:hypothetical protein
MLKLLCTILGTVFLCSLATEAQTSQAQPSVTNLIAVLSKSIDTKTATAGNEVVLRTISDVVVNGKVVIPRGSKVTGRITEVALKGSANAETTLAFTLEKAILRENVEIPLQAIVAALATPRKDSLASDPSFAMLHSNEPKMSGGPPGTATAGAAPTSNRQNANAVVGTANTIGKLDEPTVLDAESQGAVNIENVSLTWRLSSPPPVTVVTTKNKNLKLETGTQMLLRMAPPKAP